jgi:hypothetical protein
LAEINLGHWGVYRFRDYRFIRYFWRQHILFRALK